jgi:hypothetical protein
MNRNLTEATRQRSNRNLAEATSIAPASSDTRALRRPGKPTDNALVEAFNSRLRQECLSQHRFVSLEDARTKLMAWREKPNPEREAYHDYGQVLPQRAVPVRYDPRKPKDARIFTFMDF